MSLYGRLAACPEGPAPHPYPPPAPPDVPLPRWQATAGTELVAADDNLERLLLEVSAGLSSDLTIWNCGGWDPLSPQWRVAAVVRPAVHGVTLRWL
jgi:hypothetical protein